ncbi:MAG: tetratricopeptide repeat protein [Ardenticatenaceae bacterium]|nr:tetratricopeptide repeat protein [Ardenticatenaceae bacterium]
MTDPAISSIFSTREIEAAALAAYREGRQAASQQKYGKAIRFYTDALSYEGTPTLFQARVHEYRGLCHWLLSDFDAAEEDYQAALTISNDAEQIARARVRLGELADFRGDFEEADNLYRQALTEGLTVGNILVVGRARRGLGILSRKKGDTENAIRHLTQALAAFRQMGEAREQARVMTSLGRARHARGEYQYALNAHNEALTIFESLNDRWRVVQTLTDIGECHQALYDTANALHYHEKALKLAYEYGANLLKPEIQRNLGVDMVEQGRYDEGLVYLHLALDGARHLGNKEQEALALYNIARAYLLHSQAEDADPIVAELVQIAELLNADRFRALASFVRGELLFHQGQQAEAVAELNAAMLSAQTSVDRGVLWKLHATISHVVDNPQIAAVHRTIAAEFIRQTAEPLQDQHLKSCFVFAPPVLAILNLAGINPAKL